MVEGGWSLNDDGSREVMNQLEGKVAVVTGGASGIGEGIARRFVAEGARVVLGDIQDDVGREVAVSLGDGATYVHCDVTSEDDVAKQFSAR